MRQDGLVAGAAAAADGAAPSMEKAQAEPGAFRLGEQRPDGRANFVIRGDVTAILIAVGITDHHLLQIILRRQHGAAERQRKKIAHDGRAIPQIVDGFEQRHDAQTGLRSVAGHEQACLLHQNEGLQQIRHAFGLGDDVICHCPRPETRSQRRGHQCDLEFARGFVRILTVRRAQHPGAGEFTKKQRYLFGFRH